MTHLLFDASKLSETIKTLEFISLEGQFRLNIYSNKPEDCRELRGIFNAISRMYIMEAHEDLKYRINYEINDHLCIDGNLFQVVHIFSIFEIFEKGLIEKLQKEKDIQDLLENSKNILLKDVRSEIFEEKKEGMRQKLS